MQRGPTMQQMSYQCGSSQQGKQKFVVLHRAKKIGKMVFDRTAFMFRPGRYPINPDISNADRQIKTDFQIVRFKPSFCVLYVPASLLVYIYILPYFNVYISGHSCIFIIYKIKMNNCKHS